jgi:hypothetical protein
MPCNKFFLVIIFLAFAFPVAAVETLITRPEPAVDNATATLTNDAMIAQADNATSPAPSGQITAKTEPVKEIPTAPDPLQIMSDLRTSLEIRKLQVALSTQDKLLREALMPTTTKLLNISKKSKPVNSQKTRKAPHPKVVAVQGVGGKLSAVLSTGNGILTVYEGDKVGTGTVVSIAPDRVMVRYGKAKTFLNFAE